ncbi:MAG: histidine--tRNA ligase [Deltaproteobacteria bacterium]|nr:histidine--tRNA ligase [Deltaproteobacteria bacterium]
MLVKAITGFQDILPDRAARFARLEKTARDVFARYAYREIRVPEMEYTELFARGIGQTTDIVEKEMFTLQDSKGRAMSLRPEGTAGVVRAFIENGLATQDPQARLFYMGAMFRHEKPQKGRFRQFHQIGAEAFGSEDALLDAEVIAMLMDILREADVPGLRLEINSIGDDDSRGRFRKALVEYFEKHRDRLCKDCLRRLDTNPMRLLDCKVESCIGIVRSAPTILPFLNDDCAAHFDSVQNYLRAFGVEFFVNERIVRGLDYYTRTAFEVTTDRLGAQNAVAGGGRYDGLVESLGGPKVPGIGFAIGMERVVELMAERDEDAAQTASIMLVPMDENARRVCVRLAAAIRARGASCLVGVDGRSVKAQMKKADRAGARFALVIGEKELEEKRVDVKDMGENRLAPDGITPEDLAEMFAGAMAESGSAS